MLILIFNGQQIIMWQKFPNCERGISLLYFGSDINTIQSVITVIFMIRIVLMGGQCMETCLAHPTTYVIRVILTVMLPIRPT